MTRCRTVFGRRPARRGSSSSQARVRGGSADPVSSSTSRTAASSSLSPASSFPFGNDQSSYAGRWTTRISSTPSSGDAGRGRRGPNRSRHIQARSSGSESASTAGRHSRRCSSAADRSSAASDAAPRAASASSDRAAQSIEPARSHDRVVQVSQHVLEGGRGVRKRACGFADDRCGRLGCVADALRADPDLVELLVARLVAERLRALREPVPRAPNELRDGLAGRLVCGGKEAGLRPQPRPGGRAAPRSDRFGMSRGARRAPRHATAARS